MTDDVQVLLATDDRVAELQDDGWTIVGESWGARLRFDKLMRSRLLAIIEQARSAGYAIVELGVDRAQDLWRLQEQTAGDFPLTPATPSPDATLDELREAWAGGWRVFGVFGPTQRTESATAAGDALAPLVGATIIRPGADRYAETEWTAVLAEHRGRGLATAAKAASVLALADDGFRLFGTGGAATNTASLAMNRATGYEITEQWVSMRKIDG